MNILMQVAYAAAEAGPSLNSDGLVAWGVKNVVPPLFFVLGVGIIASARNGKASQNGNTVFHAVLGLFVIAGAAGLYKFADQLTTLVFS